MLPTRFLQVPTVCLDHFLLRCRAVAEVYVGMVRQRVILVLEPSKKAFHSEPRVRPNICSCYMQTPARMDVYTAKRPASFSYIRSLKPVGETGLPLLVSLLTRILRGQVLSTACRGGNNHNLWVNAALCAGERVGVGRLFLGTKMLGFWLMPEPNFLSCLSGTSGHDYHRSGCRL